MSEIYDLYLSGVSQLLQRLGRENRYYQDVLTLQGRLERTVAAIRQYGSTPTGSAEVAQITAELDRLCLEHLHQPFREICRFDRLPETALPYHNLPQPDYLHFIGREEELARIRSLLTRSNRAWIIVIDGIGGIGKSALALEVAHWHLREYAQLPPEERFEAMIWASAKAAILTADGILSRRQVVRTLDDIYMAIAVALGREDITRARPEQQDNLVFRALTQQRTLLILDNLETIDDERVNTFLRDLPAPTKCIVTTRHRIDVAYPVRLQGMPRNDGLALIAQECAKKDAELSEEDMQKLYDRTGGVPLAIVWSVAQVGYGHSAEAVLRRLGDAGDDIARYCFEGALEHICGQPAHELLLALSLFATDADRGALGYVADLPHRDREDGLVLLEKLSLVNRSSGRFSVLPLTKSYVLSRLPKEAEERYRQRWAAHFSSVVKTREFDFSREKDNIRAVLEWSLAEKRSALFLDLVIDVEHLLRGAGYWSDWMKYLEAGLALAYEEQNIRVMSQLNRAMGNLWSFRQEYDTALVYAKRAHELARECGDEAGQSTSCGLVGAIYAHKREFASAVPYLEASLAVAESVGDTRLIARAQRRLAELYLAQEHYSEAKGLLELARQYRDSQDRPSDGAAIVYRDLGLVAMGENRYQEAYDYLEKSLELAEQLKTAQDKAVVQKLQGRVKLLLGARSEARVLWEQSLLGFQRLGMSNDAAEVQEWLQDIQPGAAG
jgi:tetratricopeptide (TPR) repeat protein